MKRPFARYLAISALTASGVLAIVWLYVALMPMAFRESGYAAWAAKSTMLRECELGQVAFFGDSRLEAGVIPAAFPVPATNFAFAGGTAVEARTAIDRALQCPSPPRQAVIALIPEHFGPLQRFFWQLSVRYGFLSATDLWNAETLAASRNDQQSFAAATPDGLRGKVRDWFYASGFPSLSFDSLVQGRVFGRYGSNTARYQEILRSRGWANYVLDEGIKPSHPEVFIATGLQTGEFEASIAALRQRGVEVALLTMPFARTHPESDASFADYFAYMKDVVRRYPGVTLVSEQVPIWPNQLFADLTHLNAEGAKLFSERLAGCMSAGLLQPACDLTWRDAGQARADSAILEVQQQGDRQH